MLSEKIKELRSQITQKQTAVNTKITEAQKRAEEDKLDEATALKGEISTLKEELDALKKKLAEYEEIAGMNPEEPRFFRIHSRNLFIFRKLFLESVELFFQSGNFTFQSCSFVQFVFFGSLLRFCDFCINRRLFLSNLRSQFLNFFR